ncbi:hypothetical protein, partial [Ruminococcus sp.]|uniref:hypothetical protein n=1 Tax=Ruminococcus sp. TaxID=41978 RepID=UPI00257EC8FD
MYLENNLASKIQQSQHYTFERAVEGASPYNSEIITNSEHGRTLFAPTVIWASPTSAKSLCSLRIYIALRARKAVQI